MLPDEFSAKFDILLNSYNFPPEFGDDHPKFNPALNEYEKSVFLTKAEMEFFIGLYNGTSIPGVAFEITEESRRYLDELVRTKTYTSADIETVNDKLSDDSVCFKLEDDLGFITLELINYDNQGKCFEGFTARVYPITQDEYAKVKDNPFRGPTKYKVLRIDRGERLVELIPTKGYKINKYLLKYIKKPNPIILTDLKDTGLSIEGETSISGCEMDPLLHTYILERAVALAVHSKSLGIPSTNNKNE
jgi:hypothetical protein